MAVTKSWWKRRNLERLFLVLAGIILTLFFFRLYQRNQQNFAEVPVRLKDGTIVNLNAPNAARHTIDLLEKGFYFGDARDIAFAGDAIARGLGSGVKIDNIGELNKQAFAVSASDAFVQGGESYRKRAQLSRYLIGFTYEDSTLYAQEAKAPVAYASTLDVAMGHYTVAGTVHDKAGRPVANVLVRLGMLAEPDSLGEMRTDEPVLITQQQGAIRRTFTEDSANNRQLQSFVAYTRTDANGNFAYQRLPDGRSFELLPLQPGFEFGPSKGVLQLTNNTQFTFVQSPHKLRLFATRDFNNLKREKSLIVRMPAEVNKWFSIIGICFLASFFILHLLLTIRYPDADQLILPVLMLLTGISMLTLLSLQDPLRDRFLAQSTFYYFLAGIGILIIILFIDFRRFTTDSTLYRLLIFRRASSAANGWPWAIAAMGLLILTLFFGSGPEGSGVKVNLAGVQPSEVVKFLLIIFLAGFFATNESFISAYTRWQKRWTFFWTALAAILSTIFLFLLLGDLGPAMVCCFTFIVLFSFSRGDFIYMVATVVIFILSIWLLKNVWMAAGIVLLLIILASIFIRKGLSESSVMALVVIAGFLLLDKIPYLAQLIPGPMQRLVDRKAIWQNPWDNEVFGGDHIANAIWGMSSGGISGQGIGEGFAKTIPEAHTDMILPSMGEELGLAGILCIFIVFFIYLHRAVVIGRHTGRPFLFYLTTGIGVATFVQFLLIAGGSIGALPLSGVSLPFMSYGGSSLIINMLAAAVLLSVSRIRGSAVQMQYIARQQDKNLVPALAASWIGIVLLGVSISRYIVASGKWVVTPSLVADRSGARIFSYNPRIAILMKRLEAGTLYDRNGKILATSNPELIRQQKDSLITAGLDGSKLEALTHQRFDRYYPFAEQMYFWVGDMNTGAFMGSTNGYFGEYEHMADLRGFPAPETNYRVAASRYHESRFLPARATEMTVRKRDFSALAPLLLAGINSKEVAEFKKRNRDVLMTIDAALQTNIQTALQHQDIAPTSRISVVVMDASNGDVLTSAAYPLPSIDNPEQMQLSPAEQNKLPYWITNTDIGFTNATQPGSTAKLITALAAFNKLGLAAAKKVIIVHPQDLVRRGGAEPDEPGAITIERGIVRSNNPFFIRLANDEKLQEEMGILYMQAGLFLHGVGGYYYEGDLNNTDRQHKWQELWRKTEFKSILKYNPNNIWPGRAKGVSGMAWGQGELVATPAAMSRVAAAIANNGVMVQNRYVLKIADSVLPPKQGVPLARDPQYAALMTDYMKKQSAPKVARLGITVAGKTGTPERIAHNKQMNDGWYVFFTPKPNGQGYIVTCVRIEDTKGSGVAVQLAGTVVIPILLKANYIKSFDPPAGTSGTASPAKKQQPSPVTEETETPPDTAVH